MLKKNIHLLQKIMFWDEHVQILQGAYETSFEIRYFLLKRKINGFGQSNYNSYDFEQTTSIIPVRYRNHNY